ncbi:MAG TPA: hypothetical protein VF502_06505 [Stellaceae bacterium]
MDEESIGVIGMLLIVTGLVMTHQLQSSRAMPGFRDMGWQNASAPAGCEPGRGRDCSLAFAR